MSNIEKQVLDLGTMPTKGFDYWTPEEEAEMNNAKNGALDAAQEARTAKQETDAATDRANEAAANANGAAGAAREKAGEAEAAASAATNAATNANQAAANGNTQYNVLKQYHDNVTIPDHTRADQDHTRANTDHSTAVADHQTANTDHTNVTTNWRNEFTDAQAARAAEFNRTQQEKQAIFDSKEAERDAAIAEVTTYESKVDYLLHLFGQYATPAPQSLVIDPTRKDVAISAESMSEVAAQGWAISQPIVIRKGNIYRIKVGEASGQYVTTAMRYQYRDEQGNLRYAYKRKTQLDEHSELPVDGYLIMYGLPRDYELVVCFKYTAQYDPVVEVLTAGLLRTLAFQLGDMQDMIDQKLDVNGHSSAASVGGAMALLQKGDVPEDTYSELLTARMIGNAPDLMHVKGRTDTRTGIDDGKDVNVVVEKVWGDCIGGNQLQTNPTFSGNHSPWVVETGRVVRYNADGNMEVDITANPTANNGVIYNKNIAPAGHSVLALYVAKHKTGTRTSFALNGSGNSGVAPSSIAENAWAGYGCVIALTNPNTGVNIRVQGNVNMEKAVEVSAVTLLDLTTLFPTDPDFVTSLKSTDAIKVAHRLGFAAFTLD